MVERAMFGGAVILLLMAFVTTAEQLVVLRMIQGLITGTIAAANAMAASIVPRNRIGYAMGLLQVGLGAGVALGPLIGGAVADAYGYSAAFYVTSGLLFFSGLLVWWWAEEQFEPPPPSASGKTRFITSWRHVLASPGIPLTYSLRFLSQLGRAIILPIAPLFVEMLLMNKAWLNTFTGLVVGAASITTTLSAGYLGRLGDRKGHQRIIVICALFGMVFYFLQSLVTSAWQFLALQALVGIALGGIIPSISALLARFSDPDEAGAVYGLDNSIDSAGRAVAPMLGSAVAVWFGLQAVFVATGLLFLLLALLAGRRLPAGRATQPESSKNT
jgi:DHA1 family multidrug resistance protein-like MFS transporter